MERSAFGSGSLFSMIFLFVFAENWMLSRQHHKLCKAAIPATQFLLHAQNNRFGSPAVARKRIMIIRYYFWLFDSSKGQKQRLKFLRPFSHPPPDSREGHERNNIINWIAAETKMKYHISKQISSVLTDWGRFMGIHLLEFDLYSGFCSFKSKLHKRDSKIQFH